VLGVAILQSGIALTVGALIVALWDWRRGLALGAVGFASLLLGALWPARRRTAASRRSILDDYAPAWQFDERHARRMAAPPARVYAAIRALPAGDIRFFHLLTWLRRFGRPGPPGILNAPKGQPILDTAVRGGFVLVAEDPPREVVVGAIVIGGPGPGPLTPAQFDAIAGPGVAKAAMNFLVVPDGDGGSLVTTETRVHATDRRSIRRFAMYWRIIQPGSAFIRRMWLRAIQKRAEGSLPA
jgi:hypothetical protein